MKLNPDCIRDILIEVESQTTFSSEFLYPDDNSESLSKYCEDEIFYHIKQYVAIFYGCLFTDIRRRGLGKAGWLC